jgi:tRNA A37 threonylcarbamoyladenosine synthetase subunit TsaC/SUA5/YrdC
MNVILAQTDTTVGFLSQDAKKLYEIKSRAQTKPFLKVYSTFNDLKEDSLRIPKSQRKLVRRSKKTTFVVKNQAFRVTRQNIHSQLLKPYKWFYSTSANESGRNFQREFCEERADVIIEDKNSLFESEPSSLLKINAKKMEKLR